MYNKDRKDDSMKFLKDVYKEFSSFEASLFRYSLSFSLLLALAPSLMILIMLFNFEWFPVDIILNFLYQFTPVELISPFVEFLLRKEYHSLVYFLSTLFVSFWLASRSMYSFCLISANYENVELPKILIRIKSIFMFIILLISCVFAVAIATLISNYIPLSFAISLFLIFTLFYRMLSFKNRDIFYGMVGGLFSTTALFIFSYFFLNIIDYFTDYQSVYGTLSSFIILMLSLYIISCIIYLGFCINNIVENQDNLEHRKFKHENLYFKMNSIFKKKK